MSPHFNYIIAGAGCAGLSLVMHMIRSGGFSEKKILLLDKSPKNANDRTWCFWEKEQGLFEEVVYKEWEQLWFHSDQVSKQLDIEPYIYKMIRGIDFYNYCIREIRKHSNITIWQEEVSHCFSDKRATGVIAGGKAYLADYVFSSIWSRPKAGNHIWMLQHFKGWIIETETDAFTPEAAVLMDFRVDQHHGTAFCYVMPFSKTKALIEYTLFTPETLKQEEYDEGLHHYIQQLIPGTRYRVVDEEFGIIPMTSFKFPAGKRNLIYLGTAGGRTKGSSGYTFRFIQKHSAAIVKRLLENKSPLCKTDSMRFSFYDKVLLHVLYHKKMPGDAVFTDLFKKNRAATVLKFLDNESNLKEEMQVISSLPTMPFLSAAIKEIIK